MTERRPSRMLVAGWGLALIGGMVMGLLTALFEPASSGATIQALMTAAFATAQLGLLLITVAIFRGLFQRASRVGRRR